MSKALIFLQRNFWYYWIKFLLNTNCNVCKLVIIQTSLQIVMALVKTWHHGDSNINAMVVLQFSVWVDLLLGDPSQQQQYWCPWGRSQLTAFFLVSRGRFRICGGAKKSLPKNHGHLKNSFVGELFSWGAGSHTYGQFKWRRRKKIVS